MKTEITQSGKTKLNLLVKKLNKDELSAVTQFAEFIISSREKSTGDSFSKLLEVLNKAAETSSEIPPEEIKELEKESKRSKLLLKQGKLSTLESLRQKHAV